MANPHKSHKVPELVEGNIETCCKMKGSIKPTTIQTLHSWYGMIILLCCIVPILLVSRLVISPLMENPHDPPSNIPNIPNIPPFLVNGSHLNICLKKMPHFFPSDIRYLWKWVIACACSSFWKCGMLSCCPPKNDIISTGVISPLATIWGPPVISWFRFAPVTSSLFAYHKP